MARLILIILALLSFANAQTMFRDITYQDTCPQVLEKLAAHHDITIAELDEYHYILFDSPEWCVNTAYVRATIDNLFGASNVSVTWSPESHRWEGNEQVKYEDASLTFRVTGLDGYVFAENAVEGFRQTRGEPFISNPPTPFGQSFTRNCLTTNCFGILRSDVAIWDSIKIYTSYSMHTNSSNYMYMDISNFYYEAVLHIAQGQIPEATPEDANQF